jgi:CheY-like chemotaxis protein
MNSGAARQLAPGARKRALLIDAEPNLADTVTKVLKRPEWSIVRVPDNDAALQLAKQNTFHIVITGSKINRLSDIDLLSKIRQTHPHIRFIILADRATPAEVLGAIRKRAFSCFSKDFSAQLLADVVWMATFEPAWDEGIELLSASPDWVRVAVRCEVGTADRLIHFFREMSDLTENEKDEVAAVFRELLLNAIVHGGRFDPSQYVELNYIRNTRTALCKIKDPGQGFSLDELRDAATSVPGYHSIRQVEAGEEQGTRPGAYGALLARHYVDALVRSQKSNEVFLLKYLSGRPAQTNEG